jgi:hypothetical protein
VDGSTPLGWRLQNQQLTRPTLTTPQQVVAWLGGVQAQAEAWAGWSIGLRLPNSRATAVAEAVTTGALVRAWAMRGTLHFVSGDDVRWLTALLAPFIVAGNARRYRELALGDDLFSHR